MAPEGNDRLSCAFCIFACDKDLANAARLYPDLLAEYLAIEKETGFTMFNGASLADRLHLETDETQAEPAQGELF